MSYAIIRNTKYKRENLKGIFRHNERRNKNYSNENIDKEKSCLNYSLKSPQYSYEKEFDRIREKYNLKGQIKTVSNIACEYIITNEQTPHMHLIFLPVIHTTDKKITNFKHTKEILDNMKLELPDVPEIINL